MVLHEVHHVDRAVFFGRASGEEHSVFLVDLAVVVLNAWCLRHGVPLVGRTLRIIGTGTARQTKENRKYSHISRPWRGGGIV